MADKDPLIVDVQGIGPVEFPAGTTGAQIESWVLNQIAQAKRAKQTWGEWIGNQIPRVGGGIAGGLVGSLAGPVGTFAGTATGAALGDEWAQSREVAQGVRGAVNPLEMVAAGVTAPIPGATIGKGPLLRQVPKALAAAVPGAAASSVGLQLAESGTVDPWRTAMETGRGAMLGGAVGLGVHGAVRGAQSKAAQKLVRDERGAVGPTGIPPPTHEWKAGDWGMVPQSSTHEFQRGQSFTVKDTSTLGNRLMLLVEDEHGAQGWLPADELRPLSNDPAVGAMQSRQYLREEQPARAQQLRDLHAKHEEWVKRYTGDEGADFMDGRKMSNEFTLLKAKYAKDYGDDALEEVVADLADVESQRRLDPNPPAWTPPPAATPRPGIRAYHGSPYDFDQFSSSKIGTGEGAQSYGHGLYVAEEEAVGKNYRDVLSDMGEVLVDGTPRSLNTESAEDMALLDLSEGRADPAYVRRGFSSRFADDYEQAIRKYEGRVKPAKPGKMYEVEVNADPAQFLDWDTPISEQPKVLEVLRAHDLADDTHVFTPEGAKPLEDVTGENLYRTYGSTRGKAVASRAARRIGIPGIKYLDQGSRDVGEGSRNYVVFDDKLITILRKYGLLPFVPLSEVGRPQQDERDRKK